ncbi:hypothetical protein Syn7502_02286 [Synechococcus sp. PCC 7502]|uniref:hypothetical protein n=1 Tax=Synechococcus sp. PCC 7502 TaxID=1173263 RepID=UPI00029FC660|nr:hypothetical protein [Synechococcus sp. PCC 7502]AFY74291.1 hypothetical protein Syn7502_02286 [Synechococcus sp. PCC 7502]
MNNQRILKSLLLVWKQDKTNPLVKAYLKQLGINLEPSPNLRAERLEYEVSKVLCEAGLIDCDLVQLERLAIASEQELERALAKVKALYPPLETKSISGEHLTIAELEAKITKAKEEFEELKRRGYNPLTAIFDNNSSNQRFT